MSKTPLHRKLRMEEGISVLPINCPTVYKKLIGSMPADITVIDAPDEGVDFVHLFIRNKAELEEHIDAALRSVKYDGLLWISYPKGSSKVDTDVNRDILWELLKEKGIRPVSQVSINDTWSAIRFRPEAEVGQ